MKAPKSPRRSCRQSTRGQLAGRRGCSGSKDFELLGERWYRSSSELNAHPAHTEHDHRCNDRGYDCARDHESVSKHLADAMRDNDRARPSRKMREDKECAEPIMRQE